MDAFAALFRGKTFVVSPLSDLDAAIAKHLYSLQHCKILHLVRHGQGVHNMEGNNGPEALLSQEFFDAQLSPLGWRQVDNLRKRVEASGLARKIDLVITSPLLRTLQTAVGVFGGDGQSQTDGIDAHPSLTATTTVNCPPIVGVELCRERLGVHPCDKRRSISEYRSLFPAIDFKLIESEDDKLWKADTREPFEEVAARGIEFMKWLWTRQEKEIAVVSHGIFLQQTLNALLNDCQASFNQELCPRFTNCEIRSVVIIDSSITGSCYPETISGELRLHGDANILSEELLDLTREEDCNCQPWHILAANSECNSNDCQTSFSQELCPRFTNCEIRSVVIINKSIAGSCYPGTISGELRLPWDAAKESIHIK